MHSFIRIHFLKLSDGSAYPVPHSSITWEPPQGVNDIWLAQIAITSSRVMIHARYLEWTQQTSTKVWIIFVWDWRTGDLVRLLRLEQ